MKRDTFEIIKALEGSIEPLAETNIDEKHLVNLKEWCDLHEQIIDEICKVANKEDLRCYKSAKEIIDYARKHLEEINTHLTEYIQRWMMKMKIDEAIHSFTREAEEQENLSKTGKWFEGEDWNIKARQNCAETASNCRQIVAWLNELKQLREENKRLKDDLDKAILYGLKMERQTLDFIFPDAKNSCKENET